MTRALRHLAALLVGVLVGVASVAVVIPNLVVGIVGAVVIIAGVVAWKLLSMAGYGHEGHHAQGGSIVDAPDEVGAQTIGKS